MKRMLGLILMMGLMALSSSVSRAQVSDAQEKGEAVENWVSGTGLLTTTAIGPMSALVVQARYSTRASSLKSQIEKNRQMAKGQDLAVKRELNLKNQQLKSELERDFTKTGRKVMAILGGAYLGGSIIAGPVATWSGSQVTQRLEKARAESLSDASRSPASQGIAQPSAQ